MSRFHIPKQYFHDRMVLLLLSVMTFLSFVSSLSVLLRLNSGRGDSYIVQYRSNLGLDEFKTGGSIEPLGFVLFATVVVGFHLLLSMKAYPIRRRFAIVVLGLGVLLLTLGFIVSNSLLILR